MTESADPGTAAAHVDRYLQLCEDRKLNEASAFLAPQPRLVFPGGKTYSSLQEMVSAAARRYRWVRKVRERYLEGGYGADGTGTGDRRALTVVSLGTLYGEDLAGRPFSGIRYADVFVLRDGLIVEQHVYNDLALAGIYQSATNGAPPQGAD